MGGGAHPPRSNAPVEEISEPKSLLRRMLHATVVSSVTDHDLGVQRQTACLGSQHVSGALGAKSASSR